MLFMVGSSSCVVIFGFWLVVCSVWSFVFVYCVCGCCLRLLASVWCFICSVCGGSVVAGFWFWVWFSCGWAFMFGLLLNCDVFLLTLGLCCWFCLFDVGV